MKPRIVVIGAGLTGLTCANLLAKAGLRPVVLDKGRGIGGRLATRRTDRGFQFDHGAQYLSAKSPDFDAFLQNCALEGALSIWDDGAEGAHFVGTPGMSGFAKSLVTDFEVRSSIEVTEVSVNQIGVEVTTSQGSESYTHAVLAIPAPQVSALLRNASELTAQVETVSMTPNLTMMAGFYGSEPGPFLFARNPEADLAWIARDDSKPGRGEHMCWTAQASLEWSRAHLELSKDEIAAKMLPLLCERIGVSSDKVEYLAGHRWRYAMVHTPLGEPFLVDPSARLRVGGDWCLGPRAEHAWQSGKALAADMLRGL